MACGYPLHDHLQASKGLKPCHTMGLEGVVQAVVYTPEARFGQSVLDGQKKSIKLGSLHVFKCPTLRDFTVSINSMMLGSDHNLGASSMTSTNFIREVVVTILVSLIVLEISLNVV